MTKGLLLFLAILAAAVPARAQVIPPSQTISVVDSGTECSLAGTCAQWQLPNTAPSFTVQVTGTLTTVTLTFRGSADGVTFFNLLATKLSTGVQAATTTTTGQYAIVNPGIVALRVVGTVVTSGAANLTLTRGSASSSARAFPSFGSFATGDVLYASATNVVSGLADVAVGSYLRSGGAGVAPLWSTLVLPNAAVAGDTVIASATNTYGAVTAVATGSFFRSAGTGTAPVWSTTTWPNTATAGDLLTATSSNTIGSLAAVATGQVLASAGTSTAPAYTASPIITSIGIGGSSSTGAVVSLHGTKIVTGIADNSATTILTWSAPNAEATALIKIQVLGILGAGGAIGAGECSVGVEFLLAVTRTAGVNATSGAASASESTGTVPVAGGATCTIARSLTAVSGGTTVANTQGVQVTIAHGTGSSTNHIAVIEYWIINQLANGVTIS